MKRGARRRRSVVGSRARREGVSSLERARGVFVPGDALGVRAFAMRTSGSPERHRKTRGRARRAPSWEAWWPTATRARVAPSLPSVRLGARRGGVRCRGETRRGMHAPVLDVVGNRRAPRRSGAGWRPPRQSHQAGDFACENLVAVPPRSAIDARARSTSFLRRRGRAERSRPRVLSRASAMASTLGAYNYVVTVRARAGTLAPAALLAPFSALRRSDGTPAALGSDPPPSAPRLPPGLAQAHKPTSVTHSVVGHFTDENDLNLIVACVPRPLVPRRLVVRARLPSSLTTPPARGSLARRRVTSRDVA